MAAVAEVDPVYSRAFSTIAVTKNFVGSPHIDVCDIDTQYGISLGEFSGGALMVEGDPRTVHVQPA